MSDANTSNNNNKPSGDSSSVPTTAHKKESILELSKYMDAKVRVRCLGGRELVGILRGYDELVNLVLDHTIEYLRDPEDLTSITQATRKLGMIIVRGTQVSLVLPEDDMEEIENPFLTAEDAEE